MHFYSSELIEGSATINTEFYIVVIGSATIIAKHICPPITFGSLTYGFNLLNLPTAVFLPQYGI